MKPPRSPRTSAVPRTTKARVTRAGLHLLPDDGSSLSEPLDGTDEPIASAGYRLDVSGLLGGITERGAELANGGVEAPFEIHERVRRPEPLGELLTAHHFAGLL